jgi:uncharacterized membrane protein YphA (DoxX/SURF4 family)
MQTSSPAQLYASLVGVVLVIAGILGFFYEASFATGSQDVQADEVLGILAVNGWHNVVHILAGVLGLAAAAGGWARTYALGFGLIYLVLAIWGFADGDDIILGFLPVNTEDNVLHLILGILGLGAGAASPAQMRPATAA